MLDFRLSIVVTISKKKNNIESVIIHLAGFKMASGSDMHSNLVDNVIRRSKKTESNKKENQPKEESHSNYSSCSPQDNSFVPIIVAKCTQCNKKFIKKFINQHYLDSHAEKKHVGRSSSQYDYQSNIIYLSKKKYEKYKNLFQ